MTGEVRLAVGVSAIVMMAMFANAFSNMDAVSAARLAGMVECRSAGGVCTVTAESVVLLTGIVVVMDGGHRTSGKRSRVDGPRI